MPDTPVGQPSPPPGTDHEARISRLEGEMQEVKATLGQMLPMLVRIESMLNATLPHLATKVELAELRTEFKAEMADLRTEFKMDMAGLRARLDADTAGINTTLSHLATKAELAEKPSKAYLWAVLAALIATYGCGLAGLAVLLR